MDEADRLIDPKSGFADQVLSIAGQVRPDRQTMLFSATLRMDVEKLARPLMHEPVRVRVGKVGASSADVKQHVHVVDNDDFKWPWLASRMNALLQDGKVLIFVSSKARVEEMGRKLNQLAEGLSQVEGMGDSADKFRVPRVVMLHADFDESQRAGAVQQFKADPSAVMVATDLASRGLHIRDIGTVVNLDVANSILQHVHRIGRTGRMQKGQEEATPGSAHTLVTQAEKDFAAELVQNLEMSSQHVPAELTTLAQKSKVWKKWQKRKGIRTSDTLPEKQSE
eukprot:gnl/TRDRNA2_/TRDRNA2_98491_c0_seq1.p1 gnl/TRDRNA2_/TRDRNA2_98491_c0~~gnl/TRDRNA2_/TRDRNA2_98491_c0_seq1.p1  ORF type:complete len:281 (-),score=51.66 gnl/TRDRNA2_/TRDRNA2_98491_c0_seq1:843-1685(-)